MLKDTPDNGDWRNWGDPGRRLEGDLRKIEKRLGDEGGNLGYTRKDLGVG